MTRLHPRRALCFLCATRSQSYFLQTYVAVDGLLSKKGFADVTSWELDLRLRSKKTCILQSGNVCCKSLPRMQALSISALPTCLYATIGPCMHKRLYKKRVHSSAVHGNSIQLCTYWVRLARYRTLAVARGMRVVTYELDPDRPTCITANHVPFTGRAASKTPA